MGTEVDQDFIQRFAEAEKLCNDQQLHASLEKYTALLKEYPGHVSVLNNMGLVHERLNDFNMAAEFYKRSHELMPELAVLINNLANAYTRLEKWPDAYPLLKKMIKVDFNHENNSEKYALCLFITKSKMEARQFIESVLSKYPENKVLNRLMGRSLLHLNAHNDGLSYLQKGEGYIEFDSSGVKYLN